MLLVTICLSWYGNDTCKGWDAVKIRVNHGSTWQWSSLPRVVPPASCYNSVRRTKHEIGFFQVNICLFYSSSLCRLSHEMVASAASSNSATLKHRQYYHQHRLQLHVIVSTVSAILTAVTDGCHRHYWPYGFAISTLHQNKIKC